MHAQFRPNRFVAAVTAALMVGLLIAAFTTGFFDGFPRGFVVIFGIFAGVIALFNLIAAIKPGAVAPTIVTDERGRHDRDAA